MTAVCIRRCSSGRFYEFGSIGELADPPRHFIPIKGEVPAGSKKALVIARTHDPVELHRTAPGKIKFEALYRTPGRQFFTVTGDEGGQAKCRELDEDEAEKAYEKLPVTVPHQAAFAPLREPGLEVGFVRWKEK